MIATVLDVIIPTLYPPSDGGDHAEGAEEESLGFSPDDEVLPGSPSPDCKQQYVQGRPAPEVDLSPTLQNAEEEPDVEPETKRRRLEFQV